MILCSTKLERTPQSQPAAESLGILLTIPPVRHPDFYRFQQERPVHLTRVLAVSIIRRRQKTTETDPPRRPQHRLPYPSQRPRRCARRAWTRGEVHGGGTEARRRRGRGEVLRGQREHQGRCVVLGRRWRRRHLRIRQFRAEDGRVPLKVGPSTTRLLR